MPALREDLISALVEVPFMGALPDRQLLINILRRDVDDFPEVPERGTVRLHVLDIVLACLDRPRSLRALHSALTTMAPGTVGTTRALELIESATLRRLMAESDLRRLHSLLDAAEQAVAEPDWWRSALDGRAVRQVENLTQAFDHLASGGKGLHDAPSALALISRASERTEGQLASELKEWSDSLARRFGLVEEVASLQVASAPPSARNPVSGPPDGAGGETLETLDIEGGATVDPRSVDPRHGDSGHLDHALTGPPGITDVELELSDFARYDSEPDAADTAPHSERGERLPLGEKMPPVAAKQQPADKLPQVWGDVPQRNPNFTGRTALLEQLYEDLSVSRQTAVLPHALHGMGGVGKSQVAIEYVHRHSSEYDLVWWVPAERPGQILDSLTKLAQRLELDVSPEANTAVPVVREALSTGRLPYKNWLLVFDNAEAPEEVQRYFPTGGAGKILVTSRDIDWARVTHVIEVDVFTREESTTFLRNRNADLSERDADRLAEALGDLPLAIEQAAAWRAATGMPVDEYLGLLESKRLELLDASPSPDYRRSVAAAWKVSLDKLKEVNEAALQLLQVCSFFAPEPISRTLFAGSPVAPIIEPLDSTLSDTFRLSRAIRDIQRYALARIDHRTNTLQIHRLIQAVLIGGMDEAMRAKMRQGAHTLLANSNPNNPNQRDQWDRYQSLRPHVTVSRAVESHDARVQELVYGLIQFLYYWGDHTGSEELAEEAYEYRESDRGATDRHTLEVAKWLGWMRWINGKYVLSKELNERSLEVYRATFGDDDEGTIDAMTLLATDLRTSGDFNAARALDTTALNTARRVFGDDDPVTLGCAHSLGVSLRLVGDFKAAAKLDLETYQRREIVLGADHAETLNTLNGRVIDIRESGRYLEAYAQQEEVYARHAAAFGNDAPATLRAARALAVARRKAGDHAGARVLAAETLDKYRRRYGDEYPQTIAAALNYAVDLRHAGELGAARDMGGQILEQYRENFGEKHSYTLSARTNLAIVLRLSGEIEAAYEQNTAASRGLVETLGADHPVTLTCMTNLASDLYALEQYQAAYEKDIDTLTRSERVLGVEHPSSLACSVNLALDLRALGRIAEADRILADTMVRFRRVLHERHPATLNARENVRADCDVDPMPI